jgi:hypothetical protein
VDAFDAVLFLLLALADLGLLIYIRLGKKHDARLQRMMRLAVRSQTPGLPRNHNVR